MINQLTKTNEVENLVEMAVSGIGSVHTRRAYEKDLRTFMEWLRENGQQPNRRALAAYKDFLVDGEASSATINRALTAIRSSVDTLGEFYGLDPAAVLAVKSVKNVPKSGRRQNRWLTAREIAKIKGAIELYSLKGKQEMVVFGLLLGCALRRDEAASLKWVDIKQQGETTFLELEGKGNKTRQIPVPVWVVAALGEWKEATERPGFVFVLQGVGRYGDIAKQDGITDQAVYDIAKKLSSQAGLGDLAPHNYRRTWARHAYMNTGSIKQISLILGHNSIQTTEIYLGIDSVNLDTPLLLEF